MDELIPYGILTVVTIIVTAAERAADRCWRQTDGGLTNETVQEYVERLQREQEVA